MRKIAMLLICIMLSGCQALTFSVDGLLSAPNVADEQSAIYQALIESAGRGITLEYPRNGDYRSAFVLYDVDGDGSDETLAFYSVSSVSDSNVKISVLDRDEDGKWRSMYEVAGAGSSVDKVIFSGGYMLVGYSAQDYDENALRMYRYRNGVLEAGYENTYAILEKADLDGCGEDEIAVVKRSGLGIEVNILKSEADGYASYDVELETDASTIAGYSFGELDGKKALYLDMSLESGRLSTEIFYLGEEGVFYPIGQHGLSLYTQRPSGYVSRDYDGDGVVEIPIVTMFIGYESAAWGEAEYMTTMLSYDSENASLDIETNAYYNFRDGYILTIPSRWLNMVTVARDSGTGEVTFYKYDPEISQITDMMPIVSFASSESSGGEAYSAAGYTVLAETDLIAYYVRARADSSEPLVLTMDEIRDNFHVIQ